MEGWTPAPAGSSAFAITSKRHKNTYKHHVVSSFALLMDQHRPYCHSATARRILYLQLALPQTWYLRLATKKKASPCDVSCRRIGFVGIDLFEPFISISFCFIEMEMTSRASSRKSCHSHSTLRSSVCDTWNTRPETLSRIWALLGSTTLAAISSSSV